MKRIDFAILLLAVAVSGCATYPGDWYRIDPLIDSDQTQESDNSGSKPNATSFNSCSSSKKKRSFTDCQIDRMKSIVIDKASRNNYLEKLIGRSVEICGQHVADVAATGGSVGFGSSWAAAIFSALATANPGGKATSYAATSSILNAGGTSFNSNIYHGFITPAILREIRDARAEFLAKSLPTLKKSDLMTFSVDEATRVALEFHESCSFYKGLIAISTNSSGKLKDPADAETDSKQMPDVIKPTAVK